MLSVFWHVTVLDSRRRGQVQLPHLQCELDDCSDDLA